MRLLIIALLVVGIAFVAFLVFVGPERDDNPASFEPPAWLKALKGDAVPRALARPATIEGGGRQHLFSACNQVARVVTVELTHGAGVRATFTCGSSPDPDCRSPQELCDEEQTACIVAAPGTGGCDEDRTYEKTLDFNVGPEGGDLRIEPLENGASAVTLR
jgi:hypothetical protein